MHVKQMLLSIQMSIFGCWIEPGLFLHMFWWAKWPSVENEFVKNSNAKSTKMFVTTTAAYVRQGTTKLAL